VQLDPGEVQVDALPGQVTAVVVTVRFPTSFTTHSMPVVADVTWDGRRLGEMAEAIGYW
jgi:hypothetical protein